MQTQGIVCLMSTDPGTDIWQCCKMTRENFKEEIYKIFEIREKIAYRWRKLNNLLQISFHVSME